MSMPKPSANSKALFESLVPDAQRVVVRPMFGNVAAFVNGNMFMGLFGDDLFVRLSEAERSELLAIEGASGFEPMKGRPMKEYVALPASWQDDATVTHLWVSRSLQWASQMPEKKPKQRKRKK